VVDDCVVVNIGHSGYSEVDCKYRVVAVGLAVAEVDFHEWADCLTSLGYGTACYMEGLQQVQRNLVWQPPYYLPEAVGIRPCNVSHTNKSRSVWRVLRRNYWSSALGWLYMPVDPLLSP
ncbi:hypothetical protein PIB30_033329, partial [Stylosanthes scabra]|nr:hypothetical protein [Stylosanthes scabra]